MLHASLPKDQRGSAIAAKYTSKVATTTTPDDNVRLLVGMNIGMQSKRVAACARSMKKRRVHADQEFGSATAIVTKVRFNPNYAARYLLATGGRAGMLFVQDVRNVPIHLQVSKESPACNSDDEEEDE